MLKDVKTVHMCWNLPYFCNYHCPYCFFYGRWNRLKKINVAFPSLEVWVKKWQDIYERYGSIYIETAGGEPFCCPAFSKYVISISEFHRIGITTNLSCSIKTLASLAEQIEPYRIKWTASFHPAFAKVGNFLEKAIFLKERGFSIVIFYVAYPPQLSQMEYFKNIFEDNGLDFVIQVFRGEYRGIEYPAGYAEKEKDLINNLSNCVLEEFKRVTDNQLYQPSTRGKLCRAGREYAFIDLDGAVYRCSRDRAESIGNFFEDSFKLLDAPLPCKFDECPCEFMWIVDNDKEEKIMVEKEKEFNEEKRVEEQTEKAVMVNRASTPPYNINFTWDIHYACNYKCPFCYFVNNWEEVSKENNYPGIEKWMQVWDDIYARYGSCHIHISGGEPFTYPGFMDLVAYLLKKHTIEVDTNLSFNVSNFSEKVKQPEKFKFCASFHPEYADIDSYLEKALQLREKGFALEAICYVGYPLQLEKMAEYKARIEEKGISFFIQPFRGEFEGRTYPREYSDDEKKLVARCGPEVTKLMLSWYGGSNEKVDKGVNCRMGQMYAKIRASGNAYRCCWFNENNKLGNLLEGTFKLLENPETCRSNEPCNCWKSMVVGEEERWLSRWTYPINAKDNAKDNMMYEFIRSRDSDQCLAKMAKYFDIKTYLGIGIAEGWGLRSVLQNSNVKKLVLCDTWMGYVGGKPGRGNNEHIKRLLSELNFNLDDVVFLDGDAKEMIPKFLQENKNIIFDLAFVDDGHSREEALQDLNNVMNNSKAVLFHDVFLIPHLYEVSQEVANKYKKTFDHYILSREDYHEGHGQSLFLRKMNQAI